MASEALEAILTAMFDAEFCAPEAKRVREAARDALLRHAVEQSGMPIERLKLAILSSRHVEYRGQRLARELPSIPPRLRSK